MRSEQGGTQKYCPNCETITVCKAVNPSRMAEVSGQRFYKSDHADIHWFRRGLICQSCEHEFLTAELEESFLEELVELREALKEIKVNAEAYVKESKSAGRSLEKLTGSLQVLRALDIYQKA